ncbi:hypothetical protein D4R49_01210 [bacterium]|nr:MAG: hypothetical protein D4R49_01210 [bacterium]
MSDDYEKSEVFKDNICATTVLSFEADLKKLVIARRHMVRRGEIPVDVLNRGFEKRAAEIIEELVQFINPGRSENIRKMNKRVIWEIYWRLQEGWAETRHSIFALLAELNSDPPFISDFAYTSRH